MTGDGFLKNQNNKKTKREKNDREIVARKKITIKTIKILRLTKTHVNVIV
jgi:hypothetical protein